MKLKRQGSTGGTAPEMFNTDFLRHTDKVNEFNIALNNRFLAHNIHLKRRNLLWWTKAEGLGGCTKFNVSRGAQHKKNTVMCNGSPSKNRERIKKRFFKKETAINISRIRAGIVKTLTEYIEANNTV